MMKQILCVLFLFFAAQLNSFAQTDQDVVLRVDGSPTTVEEFKHSFLKNYKGEAITKDSLDSYMNLYINFRLKVQEARDKGLDTVQKYVKELEGHRANLARPYLNDNAMLSELMKEAYEHMKTEVRASHILIKCDPMAPPADTIAAYRRIMALRERIMNGEDFGNVARSREGSEDPSVKDNGGDIGYFTAFQMVYPFEQAAYITPLGQVSMPIRTRYGYHLVKVTDKRAARGEVQVAHILVKQKPEDKNGDVAKAKIEEIHQKLLAKTASFDTLAMQFSDDPTTAKKGGVLDWFGPNKMVTEFEEAAFSLKNDNDICAPFKTDYGWHIIKRLGYRPVPTYESAEKDIKSKVGKDSRSEITRKSFIEKLKKDYHLVIQQNILDVLVAKADSNALTGKLYINKKLVKKTLFQYDENSVTVAQFNDYFKAKGRSRPGQSPQDFVLTMCNKMVDEKLMAYEESKLESKYPAFRLMLKEYKEGILYFELADQEVWTKSMKDTAGLRSYYETNKSKFMWPRRADVVVFTCANQSIATEAIANWKSGMSKSEIAAELNKNSQLNIQVEQGLFGATELAWLGDLKWEAGQMKQLEENGQIKVAIIKGIVEPTPQKLEEIRGIVTTQYQNYLNQEWEKNLRKSHKYEVNWEVLHSIH
ncbi:MAG: peptidylprolyl isomerase [Flavobacteriales bacterium]